jgi:hypothetical protein
MALPTADSQPVSTNIDGLRPPSHSPTDVAFTPGIGLARKLGWFSIALGAVELLAPRSVEQVSGVRSPNLLRVYGLREIVTGIGILNSKQPSRWMWARVAGDSVDLATLAVPLTSNSSRRRKQALGAAIAVAGVTVADMLCASQLTVAAELEGSGYRRADAGLIAASGLDGRPQSTGAQL